MEFNPENISPKDLVRARLDVHLEEYKQLSAEIKLRLGFQQTLTNYQLVAVGIIATFGIKFLEKPLVEMLSLESVRYYLLLTPLVFLLFSWSHYTHDIMIITLARYINEELSSKIKTILALEPVLGFDEFLQGARRTLIRKFGVLAMLGQEFGLHFVIPIVFLLTYLSVFFYFDLMPILDRGDIPGTRLLQFIVLILDISLYVTTIGLRVRIGQTYLRLINARHIS